MPACAYIFLSEPELNAILARCLRMLGCTPRQLLSLWPVLAGSVVLGVLIALAS
jgi:hypothetical protein